MGNVVSSLLMYALQAAWFCQRLIDQDYRQNYGSRSKPIMDIDETDLDVFLSKCRSYYMSKRNRSSQIQWEQSPETERSKKKRTHHRSRNGADDPKTNSSPHLVCSNIGTYDPFSKCFDTDSEGFLSRMDRELASRHADFTRLIMSKDDLDNFLSKSHEMYGKRDGANERSKSGSPKTERRKRKRVFYRERYNPKSVQDRTVEASNLPCEASLLPRTVTILAIDGEDVDSASRNDCFNIHNEDSIFVGHGERKRHSEARREIDRNFEVTSEKKLPPSEVSEIAVCDSVFVMTDVNVIEN